MPRSPRSRPRSPPPTRASVASALRGQVRPRRPPPSSSRRSHEQAAHAYSGFLQRAAPQPRGSCSCVKSLPPTRASAAAAIRGPTAPAAPTSERLSTASLKFRVLHRLTVILSLRRIRDPGARGDEVRILRLRSQARFAQDDTALPDRVRTFRNPTTKLRPDRRSEGGVQGE